MNWYYVENGQQTGPVTAAQLDELAAAGTIKSDTLVWAEGMPNWVPYSQARAAASGQPPVLGQTPLAGQTGTFPGAVVSNEEDARKRVQGPAVGLMIVGAFGLLGGVFAMTTPLWVGAMMQWLEQMQPDNPGLEQLRGMSAASNISNLIFGAVNLAVAILTLYAAFQMRNLRGYSLAVSMSIISMLPYLSGCCCIGLPIGIWALVVLLKPEVKTSFS